MKFEEFKKYKMIAESQDVEMLQRFPEAERIHQWMEETGRIDESFWGAIWSWLRTNFSFTARKLHRLADEYEKELEAEVRAEYGKIKDRKDLGSVYRRSFAGRIAEDIEDKMELIASNDEDYRELVRTLINKKKLKVKKKMLEELSGQIDPEDRHEFETQNDEEEEENNKKYNNAINKLSQKEQVVMKEASSKLNSKISSEKSKYNKLGFTSREKVENLVKLIIYYQNALSQAGKAEFTTKEIEKTLGSFYKFVMEGAKKMESSKIKIDEAIEAITKVTLKFMNEDKPQPFDKLGAQVFKDAQEEIKKKQEKNNGETSGGNVENKVTGPLTDVIMDPKEVEKAIDTAKEETGKKSPTEKEIIEEVNAAAKSYYDSNKERFLEELTSKVEEFNKKSESERSKDKLNFFYSLNSKMELDLPTASTIEAIYPNLLQVVGKIVPLFNMEKGKRSHAFMLIDKESMFEIYAVKKNDKGSISDKELDAIVNNIKEKIEKKH